MELVERAGMNVVQILPVNDTTVHGTWWDSYPYSSVSVFALHPLYLRIQQLIEEPARIAGPGARNRFRALRRETERARRALDLKEVDYEATSEGEDVRRQAVFEAVKTRGVSGERSVQGVP